MKIFSCQSVDCRLGRKDTNTHTHTHPTQCREAEWETVLAQRPSQTLCVLGNHRVWYSLCREGPCGRNRRAGACPSLGPEAPPPSPCPPQPSPNSLSPCSLASSTSPVCASTCPSQTAPSEEFTQPLPPFTLSLFHFLFFSFSLSFLYLTPQTLLLPHAILYAALMPHNGADCSPL